jgi:hypothetical protein
MMLTHHPKREEYLQQINLSKINSFEDESSED